MELAVIDRKNNKWRVEYPIGKVLLETDNWLSDVRVSPDGRQVAFFRHPAASKDDRGNVLLLDREGQQKADLERNGKHWRGWHGRPAETKCGMGGGIRGSVLRPGEHPEGRGAHRVLRDVWDAAARYCATGRALVSADVQRIHDGRWWSMGRKWSANCSWVGHGDRSESDARWNGSGDDGRVGTRRDGLLGVRAERWMAARR